METSDYIFQIIGAIGVIILCPFIYFLGGWITGVIIKCFMPNLFLKGLGLIGLNISKDSIPLFCGTLGVIGPFFKSVTQTKSK